MSTPTPESTTRPAPPLPPTPPPPAPSTHPHSNVFVARWSNLTPWGVLVTRCEVAVAALFLFAAYHKLWGEQALQIFSQSVRAFHVTDSAFANQIATAVTPWVEVVAAVCLLLGVWSRAAATVLCLMLAMFIVLILRAIMNGYDLECGCFGDLSPFCPKKVGYCNIVQNSILLAFGLIIALTPRSRLARSARAV